MSMSNPPPPPPPSPPPKSPSVLSSSHASHSTTSLTTDYPHSPARPTHAQRAVRQQASIHLTRANMGVNEDEFESRDAPAATALALAPTPTTGANPNRPPSLSFLTHDPAYTPSSSSHNLPGSASASASRRSSVLSASSRRRISGMTTRSFQSGMADIDPSASPPEVVLEAEELDPRLSEIPSFTSGMAVQAPSPPLPAKPKSLKSATSTSSKTRKRASNSTIHRRSFQRKYGKWEWEADMSPLLEGDSRRREETMELAALLGRATVLERMLKAGKRVSGTPVPSLKHLASTKSSTSRRSPSRRSQSTPRRSLSISIRSVRRHLSRRLRRKPSSNVETGEEDAFTEIESQSGFGSAPPVEVLLSEKERGWVVLLPEKSEEVLPPPLPEKDGGCLPSPTCFSPTKTDDTDSRTRTPSEVEREVYVQSPHLGHRSPDHHRRQSVLSYISVGRWSASTQGRRRKRGWVIGVTIGSVVGVIVLTGVLAGLLSKRGSD